MDRGESGRLKAQGPRTVGPRLAIRIEDQDLVSTLQIGREELGGIGPRLGAVEDGDR